MLASTSEKVGVKLILFADTFRDLMFVCFLLFFCRHLERFNVCLFVFFVCRHLERFNVCFLFFCLQTPWELLWKISRIINFGCRTFRLRMNPGLWEPFESSSRILTYFRKSAMLCTASSWKIKRIYRIILMTDPGAGLHSGRQWTGQLTGELTRLSEL